MTDDIMATVHARIATEQERLAAIEAEIISLQEARGRAENEVARLLQFADTYYELSGIQPPQKEEQDATAADTRRRPKNPPRDVVAKNALEIIEAFGRPATRKELFEELAYRGLAIFGKDPEMVLSTMLWREADKIVRIPNYGYWPKDQDFPPAFYFPKMDDVLGVAAQGVEGGVEADDAE